MKSPLKQCGDKDCKNEFKPFNSLDKFCSWECAIKNKKSGKVKKTYRIPQVSKKRKAEKLQYDADRKVFLEKPENWTCFIEGCNSPATTVEHRSGRIGSNYLDQSTWAGCCWFHNLELERDPELSKKYQLSKIHDGKKI